MSLYHIHLKGIKDDKWKEGKEFVISDNFTNRLGNRINNFNCWTSSNGIDNAVNDINILLERYGYPTFEDEVDIVSLVDYLIQKNVDRNTLKDILKRVKKLAFDAAMFKREMAMESFRRDYNNSLPSRQKCIYATDEAGIGYWGDIVLSSNTSCGVELFRIDPMDDVFKTNEIFIPNETLNYEKMYKNSYEYWSPKFKKLSQEDMQKNEYLVKGRVRVLEKMS